MIYTGDCLEEIKKLPDSSVDAIVTDPPYELGFMGKSWDNTGIANNVDMWKECLRVLKSGGHLLSFGGTRTYHRMASAIEDAGFEVRDMIEWVYGSGFPKSLNIGKAVDKMEGTEYPKNTLISENGSMSGGNYTRNTREIASELGKEWSGWGTALKPAHEPICMARKPLAEKTVAENCLKYGTGGINIDESRVGISQEDKEMLDAKSSKNPTGVKSAFGGGIASKAHEQGRFPANLIHDNSEEVRECFPEVKGKKPFKKLSGFNFDVSGEHKGQKYESQAGLGETGNASRFFKSIIYQAKASKSERNKGCEGLPVKQTVGGGGMNNTEDDVCGKYGSIKSEGHNFHPTVKPIALMEYLINMVTREGQTVLDPFAGSGTTLIAAKGLGRKYIGIELEPEYVKIAEARLISIKKRLL